MVAVPTSPGLGHEPIDELIVANSRREVTLDADLDAVGP